MEFFRRGGDGVVDGGEGGKRYLMGWRRRLGGRSCEVEGGKAVWLAGEIFPQMIWIACWAEGET